MNSIILTKKISQNIAYFEKKCYYNNTFCERKSQSNVLVENLEGENMNYEELFIESNKLPKPLSKKELYSYLEQYKQGDLKAREQVIIHNIRLVLYQVSKNFANTPYDKKELVSIGIVGLVKSVDTFDTDKNFEFATYATRCIDNEILMFLRKGKKSAFDQSINTPIGTDKEGNEKKIEDILEDDTSDFVSEYENQITYNEVRKVVYNLPNRDREIILLHFGFIDDHLYTQKEIADKLKISQSYVSRLITKIVKRIGIQLQKNGVIETVGRTGKQTKKIKSNKLLLQPSSITPTMDIQHQEKIEPVNQNKVAIEESSIGVEERNFEKKRGKKLQTIYEYLKGYTREDIDVMLGKLTEEEMSLVKLRYGEDLDNPVASSTWGKEETNKFYGSLIPKMKRLLSNPEGKRKKYTKRTQTISDTNNQSSIHSLEAPKVEEVTQPELISQKGEDSKAISPQTTSEIEKDDCLKILELMRTPSFGDMLKSLTPKEAVITCLKLGYVDGKYFTTESIAGFLGIETSEVIETTKNVLFVYKENINHFIDKAVEVATGSSLVLKKKEN